MMNQSGMETNHVSISNGATVRRARESLGKSECLQIGGNGKHDRNKGERHMRHGLLHIVFRLGIQVIMKNKDRVLRKLLDKIGVKSL